MIRQGSPLHPDHLHGANFSELLSDLCDRVYAECARLHPEIVARDKEWLSARGFLPQ
ncbi:Hypothetical protein SCF082_LOCUS48353, partial [Durusdinium trenchii]